MHSWGGIYLPFRGVSSSVSIFWWCRTPHGGCILTLVYLYGSFEGRGTVSRVGGFSVALDVGIGMAHAASFTRATSAPLRR